MAELDDLKHFELSQERGFLPVQDPAHALPRELAAWDEVGADLPKLLAAGRARAVLAALPELDPHTLPGGAPLRRAMLAAVLLRPRLRVGRTGARAARPGAGRGALVRRRGAARPPAGAVVRLLRARQLAPARPRRAARPRQSRHPAELPGRRGRGLVHPRAPRDRGARRPRAGGGRPGLRGRGGERFARAGRAPGADRRGHRVAVPEPGPHARAVRSVRLLPARAPLHPRLEGSPAAPAGRRVRGRRRARRPPAAAARRDRGAERHRADARRGARRRARGRSAARLPGRDARLHAARPPRLARRRRGRAVRTRGGVGVGRPGPARRLRRVSALARGVPLHAPGLRGALHPPPEREQRREPDRRRHGRNAVHGLPEEAPRRDIATPPGCS